MTTVDLLLMSDVSRASFRDHQEWASTEEMSVISPIIETLGSGPRKKHERSNTDFSCGDTVTKVGPKLCYFVRLSSTS